ncbi:SGNH/GDSL hydrolase family protein [Nocardia sp. NPDC051570]|uniref:SGNH/GDSL hydrolase family protein n=1 Tax=Nocardia sp. NPDC051570 TaxID=3364324 RepID=UPI00378A4F57
MTTSRPTAFLLAALALAATAASAHAQPDHPTHYVALGSSYAAGPGLAPTIDIGCARSGNDYPHRLAQALRLDLVDATCSGATTADVLHRAQRVPTHATVPPQIQAVTPDTDLVTVTIGGNDLGLIGGMIADSCPAIVAGAPALHDPVSAACKRALGHQKQSTAADFTAVRQAMADIVDRIHDIAPSATVLLVEYLPALSPDAATCSSVPLTAPDARTARHTWEGLIAATRAAARDAGAGSIAIPDADAHTACSPEPWVGGFHNPVTTGPLSMASSYHPTEAGMAAVATELEHRIQND